MYLRSPLTKRSMFASHSVCTTVAWVISSSVKFVDEVGSTVFYWNMYWVSATSNAITKANLPVNFTIFHCRMSPIQPAWPDCTTSVSWHMCCWHFCSCSSHKTMPTMPQRGGRHAPLGTRVLRNCSFYWHHSGFDDNNMGRLKKLKRIFNNLEISKINIFPWYLLDNRFNKKQTALAFCGKKMESFGTQLLIIRCYVTYPSFGITQIFIMVAGIGWKVKWQLQKDWDY